MRKFILLSFVGLTLSGCVTNGTYPTPTVPREALRGHYYYNNRVPYEHILKHKINKCINSEEAYYRTIKGLYLNRSPLEMQYRGCK
jgi:hypothetical protein